MITVIIVSVTVNFALLVALFYKREGHHYIDGITEGEKPFIPAPRQSWTEPRFYWVERAEDVSGVSGEGRVAQVAEFSDGHAVIHWFGRFPWSTPVPHGVKALDEIHGHNGKTRLVPVDAG